jgi:hypothetical protein
MYIVVTTFYALPGKLPELIGVIHEYNKTFGIGGMVLTPVAGKLSEVKFRSQVETLSEYEEQTKKAQAHKEYPAFVQKVAALVVPGVAHTDIYRQV